MTAQAAPVEPVDDENRVAAIAKAIRSAPLVAFDLEFLAQDRLVPTLCLVQVAWLPDHVRLDAPAKDIVTTTPEVALIDPLAVDTRPLIDVLAAHPRVVAHAARQDLGLLATRFGIAMPAIADTQIMAAFAGLGDQIGFAALANDLLGLSLGKELQWTDWAQRPLTPGQLAYAEADVRYLPALFALLAEKLGPRMAWALAESSEVAADSVAAAEVTPETAWKQLSTRGLDTHGLAALIELATWRHQTAIALDRPLGQVLNEKLVIELARNRPRDGAGVRALKGLSPIAKQRVDDIAAAIAAARPEDVPVTARSREAASNRAQRWAELLLAIVQLVAERTGVAARLLATRADAEEFARVFDEGGVDAVAPLPPIATWRRDVIGTPWLDFLTGKAALVGDASATSGLALVSR